MKRLALGATLTAAATYVVAQVQLYGVVDAGLVIETKSRVNPSNPNNVPGNSATVVIMSSLVGGSP